ncbi:hypothetical protein VZO05_03220 [Aggregatilineales bacterium SYSU G02658]
MTANIEAMLRAAENAVKAGKKTDARALLERVLELEEYNEQAWVELSKLVDNIEEKRTCLENILVINPQNQYARTTLDRLDGVAASPPTPSAPSTPAFAVSNDDLFSGIAFDAQPDDEGWSDEPDPWATPTSSASAVADNYTPDIPDDWAASLVKKSSSPALTDIPATGAFTGFDDDLFSTSQASAFNSDPFTAPDFATPPPAFQTTDFDIPEDAFGSSPTADPFTTAFDSSDFSGTNFGSAVVEDEFDMYSSRSTPAEPLDDFEALLDTSTAEDLDSLFRDEPSVRPAAQSQPLDGRSPEELFALIPSEIKAGRIPGTDGSLPGGTRLLLAVSILLNIGALAFLVARVMGISPI